MENRKKNLYPSKVPVSIYSSGLGNLIDTTSNVMSRSSWNSLCGYGLAKEGSDYSFGKDPDHNIDEKSVVVFCLFTSYIYK